jgi:hypothetical protein
MGHISFVGKLDAITLRAGAPAIAPGFTLELMAKHSLDFWLTSEDLPDPNNRVTVNRDGEVVLTYTPNNLKAHELLKAHLQSAMKQNTCSIHGRDCHQGLFARNLYVGQQIPLAGVAHQNGTIRFGHDRARRELQSARRGQFVRGRWQFLSLQRRGEPGTHDHGECIACR